jgi:hypothetical protein
LFYGTTQPLRGWSVQHFIGYSFFLIWHAVNILHSAATVAFVATTLSLNIAIVNVTNILSDKCKDSSSLPPSSNMSNQPFDQKSSLGAAGSVKMVEKGGDVDWGNCPLQSPHEVKKEIVRTVEDCIELYKALLRHVNSASTSLSNWFLLHGLFTAVSFSLSLYYINTIRLPGPEFVDISTSLLYLWTLSLPFASCAKVSTRGNQLQKIVDISSQNRRQKRSGNSSSNLSGSSSQPKQQQHPLHDKHDKAIFMAFIARNPVGFMLNSFGASTKIDYTLLRFTSAGTIIYIIYYATKIMKD